MNATPALKHALAGLPGGVTLLTTIDDERWQGFTASSFCSLSADPPLVLACLATTAHCFPAFMRVERFVANVLSKEHREIAERFATKGGDKFANQPFRPDRFGPVLANAVAVLRCTVEQRLPGGDHVILVGRIEQAEHSARAPLVYCRRTFHSLSSDEVEVEANSTSKLGPST